MTLRIAATVTVCALAALLLREFTPGFRTHSVLAYTAAAFMLPFAFQATKALEWDRWIGNLSYPIYVFHAVVIAFWANFVGPTAGAGAFAVAAVTIVISIGFNVFVDSPLERFRQRRIDRLTQAAPAPSGE